MKSNNIFPFFKRVKKPCVFFSVALLSCFLLTGCGKGSNELPASTPTPIITESVLSGTNPLPNDKNQPMTEETREAYKKSILSSLSITKKDDKLSGTHANLLSTVVTITLYDCMDEDILKGCFSLIADYETRLSRTMEGSELYCLNHSETGTSSVSKETAELISTALSYGKRSDGAFNIAIAPVSSLWTFNRGYGNRPTDAQIQEQLAYIDVSKVEVNGTSITFADPNMGLELGAISKGYIADRVKEYLLENGVESALIYLGGNTLLVGSKPNDSAFRIGIQMPFSLTGETLGILSGKDISIVSSGIYEKYFTEGTTFYHHILDPKTGYPFETNILEVTILSPLSVDGDALSTLCFAYGVEKGLEYINSLPDTYAVFVTGDLNHITGEIDNFALHYSDGFLEYSGFETD